MFCFLFCFCFLNLDLLCVSERIRLVNRHKAGQLDLSHCVVFGLDEYCGLGREDPHSQHSFFWEHFLRHVNVLRENVYVIAGHTVALDETEKIKSLCDEFEESIRREGGLDLAFFGTGADGQVARNEPGSSLRSRTRAKTLAYDTVTTLAARYTTFPTHNPSHTQKEF